MESLEGLGLERYCALQHGIQQHSKGPEVDVVASIALVCDNLWCEVGRCTTLFLNRLVFGDEATDTEVTNLNAPLMIHQYVIQFDVSMQDAAAVTVSDAVNDLLKDALGCLFI